MITVTGSQIISIFIQSDEVLKLGHQFPLLAHNTLDTTQFLEADATDPSYKSHPSSSAQGSSSFLSAVQPLPQSLRSAQPAVQRLLF